MLVGVGMGVGVGVASVLYNRQVNKLRMCFLYSNTVLYSCMLQESDLISLNDCSAAFSLLDTTKQIRNDCLGLRYSGFLYHSQLHKCLYYC